MSNIINFHNRTLNVAMNISPPYVFMKQTNGTGSVKWISDGGAEIRLLETLAKHFNFQYEIFNTNASWGNKLPNGSWNGLMRRIIDRKSEIGLGGVTLNLDRYEALPFLYPHIVSRVTFLTPAPRMAPNLYLSLKPFHYDVWTAFLFSLVGCLIIDRLYSLVCGRSFFMISVYALFRQQYEDDHRDWPQRIWMIFWIVFTFILTTAYAGNLVSLITIPIRMKTIDTIHDLLEAAQSNRITISGLNSAYFDALRNSSLPVYKELSKYLTEVSSKTEGYELVANGKLEERKSTMSSLLLSNRQQFAFISTEESLKYGQMLWGESLIYMTDDLDGGAFFIDLLALPVAHNFPHRREFNRAISCLLEAGIFDHWQDLEYRKLKSDASARKKAQNTSDSSDSAADSSTAHFDDFTISQLQSFFFLYLFGIAFSLLAFSCELLYKHYL